MRIGKPRQRASTVPFIMKGDTMESTREVDERDLYNNLGAKLLGDENYNLFISALEKLTDEELDLLSRIVWWNCV